MVKERLKMIIFITGRKKRSKHVIKHIVLVDS